MLYFIIAILTFTSYFIFVPELFKYYWPEQIDSSKLYILINRILVSNIKHVSHAYCYIHINQWILWHHILFKPSFL